MERAYGLQGLGFGPIPGILIILIYFIYLTSYPDTNTSYAHVITMPLAGELDLAQILPLTHG